MSQKTNKSIAKRFKKTASGKLLRRKPGYSHLRRKKTKKQRSEYRGKHHSIGKGMMDRLKQLLSA